MGMMVEGVWRDVPRDTKSTGGELIRPAKAWRRLFPCSTPRLCGRQFTEADVRVFTTLVRFDAVYYSHFKCNLRRLTDFSS
jgi:glutathionyl-hydroquinone reductase